MRYTDFKESLYSQGVEKEGAIGVDRFLKHYTIITVLYMYMFTVVVNSLIGFIPSVVVTLLSVALYFASLHYYTEEHEIYRKVKDVIKRRKKLIYVIWVLLLIGSMFI